MPKQDTTKSSHKDTPTTTAAFREYSNQHFGTYYSRKVDDMYEAMYEAKYPKRITPTIDLKTDKQAVLKIAKYRLAARNNSDIQDVLTDFKVQFVDPRKPTTFLPKFAYVKHTSGSWAPVVLPQAFEKRGTKKPENKKKEGGGDSTGVGEFEVNKQVSDPEDLSVEYVDFRKTTPSPENLTAVKADFEQLNAYLKQKLLTSDESRKVFEKIGQASKLLKRLTQTSETSNLKTLYTKVFTNFDKLKDKHPEMSSMIDRLAELMETKPDSDQAFFVLNTTVLPSFDLIDNVRALVRARVALNKLTQIGGGDDDDTESEGDADSDDGTDSDDAGNGHVPRSAPGHLPGYENYYNDTDADNEEEWNMYSTEYQDWRSILRDPVEIPSDDEDVDFNPDSDDAQVFMQDQLEDDQYNIWYTETINRPKQMRNNRLFVYFCYVLMIIFSVMIYGAVFPVWYGPSVTAIQQAPNTDAPPSDQVFTNPLRNYTIELPLENQNVQPRFFGSNPTKLNIDIIIPHDAQNDGGVTDYLKKFVTPPTDGTSSMTSCVLAGKPNDVLSIGQQLFARNEMTLQYYMEMLKMGDTDQIELRGVGINQMKHYVKAVENNEFMVKIIEGFNNFAKEMTTKELIETKFNGILSKEQSDKERRTQAYKHRMKTFKNVLIRHVETHGEGMALEDSCSTNEQENRVQLTLDHYTQGLVMDLRMNYKNIAKRQVEMFVNTLPIFTDIFNAYVETIKTKDAVSDDIDDLGSQQVLMNDLRKKINNDSAFENILTLKIIKEIINNGPSTDNKDDTRLKQIIDVIKQISPEHKEIIDNLYLRTVYREYYTSVFTDVANAVTYATSAMFAPAARTLDAAAGLANTEVTTSHIVPNIQNSFLTTLDIIAESIQSSMVVPKDDINTMKYVAATEMSMLIYNLVNKFSTEGSDGIIQSLVKDFNKVPGATTIATIWSYLMEHTVSTMEKQTDKFVQITKGAMQLINTKRSIMQGRLNNMDITGNIMNLDGVYTLSKMVLKGVTGDVKGIGKEAMKHLAQMSSSYIDLQMEIQKHELALVILHLQNNVLINKKKTDDIFQPDQTLNLSTDKEESKFLGQYYGVSEFPEKYGSQILQRLVNILGLSFVQNSRLENILDTTAEHLTSSGGQYRATVEEDEDLEEQFIDSFIANAKQHNTVVLGKLRTQKDIDMRLKKKLLKSYINHNPHMIRKLTKYLAGGAKLF